MTRILAIVYFVAVVATLTALVSLFDYRVVSELGDFIVWLLG